MTNILLQSLDKYYNNEKNMEQFCNRRDIFNAKVSFI